MLGADLMIPECPSKSCLDDNSMAGPGNWDAMLLDFEKVDFK